MSGELPHLTNNELNILWDLRLNHPRQFYTNVSTFFLDEMKKYIYHNQVFRVSIMGETRSGKSEAGQSICFKYISVFNDALKNGYVNSRGKNIDFKEQIESRLNGAIKVKELEFGVNKIMASGQDYLYKIRDLSREDNLSFGQIWQIDENREKSGLGSYTEKQEQDNMNNIIAKFCQCEVWIQPRKFTDANTPYGIRMFKKDMVNRCNWGLLYKIEMNPGGIEYNFLGWIRFNLHTHDKHRMEYEVKKNEWIKAEMEGSVDDRLKLRHDVAALLSKDEDFKQPNKKGTNFLRSKSQQIAILERWIMERKCQNFNEIEKSVIIDIARDIALKHFY